MEMIQLKKKNTTIFFKHREWTKYQRWQKVESMKSGYIKKQTQSEQQRTQTGKTNEQNLSNLWDSNIWKYPIFVSLESQKVKR